MIGFERAHVRAIVFTYSYSRAYELNFARGGTLSFLSWYTGILLDIPVRRLLLTVVIWNMLRLVFFPESTVVPGTRVSERAERRLRRRPTETTAAVESGTNWHRRHWQVQSCSSVRFVCRLAVRKVSPAVHTSECISTAK